MTLADAVTEYLATRRMRGSPSKSTESTLRSFCKHVGPITLAQVTSQSVVTFLDCKAEATRCSQFSGVKCFLRHYSARGLMPPLRLAPPAKPRQTRAPFIFTHSHIRAMLATAEQCQHRAFDLDGRTLRMVVLLLYATGATLDEVLSLRLADVNTKKRILRLAGTTSRPQRSLPMGKHLSGELSTFLSAKVVGRVDSGALLLTSKSGKPLNRGHLCGRFKKLQRLASSANVRGTRDDASSKFGRLQDLRYTFAVHRLQSWIAAGKDLNKLLPALSSYMGYASLMKSEEFLSYAPERFKGDLRKLLRDGEPTWTSDAGVLCFLARL